MTIVLSYALPIDESIKLLRKLSHKSQIFLKAGKGCLELFSASKKQVPNKIVVKTNNHAYQL